MTRPDTNVIPQPGDRPESAALLPILWRVIDRWHLHEPQLASWQDALDLLAPEHHGWAGISERLQLVNTFQWHEEDRSRAHGAGDEVLAAAKRSIDASNARRVQAIEALDVEIMGVFARAGLPRAGAPLNSESPGSIIDRITVLALKLYHIREELSTAGGATDESALHARLESIGEQMDDLAGCLDHLFREVAAGRVGLKLYRQVKVYKDAVSGRYRSGLGD